VAGSAATRLEEAEFVLTVFRYVAIMLSALALALGLTHALAVTPDPRLAAFSVALQVMATLCALVVSVRMGERPGSWLAFAGASMLLIATLVWATSMTPVLVAAGVKLPAWATSPTLQQASDLVPGGDLDLAALSIWFIGMSFLLLSAIREPGFRGSRVLRPRARGPLQRNRDPLPLIRETVSRL